MGVPNAQILPDHPLEECPLARAPRLHDPEGVVLYDQEGGWEMIPSKSPALMFNAVVQGQVLQDLVTVNLGEGFHDAVHHHLHDWRSVHQVGHGNSRVLW